MASVIVADLDVCLGGAGDLAVATAHPIDSMHAAVPAMAAITGARVVSVDPRGVGGSPPAAGPKQATLEAAGDDLEAVRRALGIDRWVLWGMSGGSMIAQVYALRHPDALRGLILDSAGPCFVETLRDPDCLMSPASPPVRAAGLDEGGDGSGDLAWQEVPWAGWALRRGTGRALMVAPDEPSAGMRRAVASLLAFDARPWLGGIGVPTLVLGGTEDRVAPPAQLRALHRAIPGAELVLVPGAGHVPLSDGRPEVADAVRRFLDERVRR
jgi:3-oxoadipate enol-lactonase